MTFDSNWGGWQTETEAETDNETDAEKLMRKAFTRYYAKYVSWKNSCINDNNFYEYYSKTTKYITIRYTTISVHTFVWYKRENIVGCLN